MTKKIKNTNNVVVENVVKKDYSYKKLNHLGNTEINLNFTLNQSNAHLLAFKELLEKALTDVNEDIEKLNK